MSLTAKTSPTESREADVAPPTGAIVFARDPALSAEIERITQPPVERCAAIDDIEWNSRTAPRAVFLDVDRPMSASDGDEADNDSAAIIARIKEYWPAAPIFVVTRTNEAAAVEALAQGADDFLMRPIEGKPMQERVNLRIAALERKAARETIRFGDMVIDTLQRSVSSMKGQKFLSPTEVRLISELAKAGGSVVSRESLKTRCWPQASVSDNALNRKLYEIRRRIKPLSENINIRTVYGVGFVLEHKD